ncbi:MAG TPA: GNAT family protein [Candidatus Limnocylindria bacterium]|nr:GNAT family protein [Candidatus Limnocylindria bacterium]
MAADSREEVIALAEGRRISPASFFVRVPRMFGPVLRGEKCVLRPPRKDELPIYQKWFEDPEVIRFTLQIGPPSDAREQEWFTRGAESQDSIAWVIEVDGRPVGNTGIHGIDFRHGHGEGGIVIGDKSVWRKGIASEAIALRTRFAFRELHLHKIRTRVYLENEASRRALEKSGYRETGIQREEIFRDGRWHDIWMAEVLREDWERSQQRP